jgi:hypothetical protein
MFIVYIIYKYTRQIYIKFSIGGLSSEPEYALLQSTGSSGSCRQPGTRPEEGASWFMLLPTYRAHRGGGGASECRRPIGRPMCQSQNDIKTDVREIRLAKVRFIHLAQLWALVSSVTNFPCH